MMRMEKFRIIRLFLHTIAEEAKDKERKYMKATGIVRRVDDLGRIVIPKEIRRTMRIREGEPMEIFIESGGSVIFKKYSPMGNMQQAAGQLSEALWRESECACAVCDRDTVIASGGVKGEGKSLTAAAEKAMEQRKILSGPDCTFSLWEEGPGVRAMLPVIAGGDLSGCVVLLDGKKAPGDGEVRLAKMAAGFLARQMED